MQLNFSGHVVDATGKKKRKFTAGDVLAGGEYITVPTPAYTMVFNHRGEAVRLGDAAMKAVTDGAIFDAASHRPGHRCADRVTQERTAGARAVYVHALQSAWRAGQ